jgi:hypothetical protein
VKRQLFAGTGAEVFWAGSGSGYVNLYKMLQKALNVSFILKFEVKFKNCFFVTIYFKKPFDYNLCF